ncbi:LysE family translocator [Croceiramulus getboli]|nr:LysE family transporter [Flavobacteriaceae bacterium YJPT1-3]
MLQDLPTALTMGFILAFLVGPVFFVLLETAVLKGFRSALAFDLGVVTADIVFILIAYYSTNQILEKIKDDPGLFIFGGTLLTAYGVISLLKMKKKPQHDAPHPTVVMNSKDYLGLMAKGFLLNFINIGVLAFWLGVLIVAGPQMEMDERRIFFFFAVILGMYLLTDVGKIVLAKRLKRKLTPIRIHWIKKTISIIMIVFGIIFMLKGLFPDEAHQLEDQIEKMTPESPMDDL